MVLRGLMRNPRSPLIPHLCEKFEPAFLHEKLSQVFPTMQSIRKLLKCLTLMIKGLLSRFNKINNASDAMFSSKLTSSITNKPPLLYKKKLFACLDLC